MVGVGQRLADPNHSAQFGKSLKARDLGVYKALYSDTQTQGHCELVRHKESFGCK